MMFSLSKPQYAGWYRLEAHKIDSDGKIVSSRVVADWFPNVITDVGLDSMGTHNIFDVLQCAKVGSGTVTPATTDTALQTFIGGTSTNASAASSAIVVGPPRYAYLRISKRFDTGVAAGNLTEIGMGRADTNTDILYSRALIVDGLGNPTTITILSDEVLDVTYELRRYYDIADMAYSGMVIAGVSYSGIIRPTNINDPNIWYGYANSGPAGAQAFASTLVGNSGIGANTLVNTLPGITSFSNNYSNLAYGSGNLYRDYVTSFGLAQGNVAGGITGIYVQDAYGQYQISVSPAIPKDATKVMTFTFRCGPWSRYP